MLQKLLINNYAIIDHLSLQPDAHLNTITGETGAGKSIILGALSLILGERADTSVLINKEQKSVIETHFDIKDNKAFKATLKEEELEDGEGDATCIIRREIAVSGKSRAFINDTPVTLPVLGRLTGMLVDLQQQFGHLSLEDDTFQMDVVDAIAGNFGQRTTYRQVYNSWKQTANTLEKLKSDQVQWQKEADYKQFLFDELQTVAFTEGEVEDAEQQLKQLNHAERILTVLTTGRGMLEEGEQPLINELRRVSQQLSSITEVMPDTVALQERLNAAYAELKDIVGELESLEGKISLDPALMQQLQERMDIGYKLFKKHAVSSTEELLQLQATLEEELQASNNASQEIERLTKELDNQYKALLAEAKKLSDKRKETAPKIATRVNELLTLVGMPNARIRIDVTPRQVPDRMGMDAMDFRLDANKSGQFLPIYKAASGGEMSRIMLCIKSLTAKAMHLPTLIFDEVDTGISGEAAKQVGVLLRELAQYHQIICITHQPQVAARGTQHFFVYKNEEANGRITTKVRTLNPDERVEAIARMIGGEKPGEAALQHARELVA